MTSFNNKKSVVVIGASGEIGIEISRHLLEDNYSLLLTYSSKSQSQLEDFGRPDDVHWSKLDVRDSDSVKQFASFVESKCEAPYGLVYCAGRIADSPLMMLSDASWNEVVDTI